MFEVKMPKIDHLSEEAIVVKWLKVEGDYVNKGEPLLQIETGKAVLEVESPHSGVVIKLYVAEGDIVPIHAQIADIAGG